MVRTADRSSCRRLPSSDGTRLPSTPAASRSGRLTTRRWWTAARWLLTVRELQLLTELAHNADRVMTREELYRTVWGRCYRKSDRSVDVYVGRLRAKLDRALPGWRFIHTHTGIGYRFSPQA